MFDQELNRIAILPTYDSLVWSEQYQGMGYFTLFVSDKINSIDKLVAGNYLFQNDKDTGMVITYVKSNSIDKQVTVRGYTTLFLLEQRVIRGTVSITNAEQSMYSIVKSNLFGAPIEISEPEGFTAEYNTQYTGGHVLERLESIGAETNLGFKVIFDPRTKTQRFKVYKGYDRTAGSVEAFPAIFSEEFGNLSNVNIIQDESLHKNYAIVAGGGEGNNRVVVEYGETVGLERKELYVDARDLQRGENESLTSYQTRLVNRGIDKLNDRLKVNTFVAEIDPKNFRDKFNLGDIVTCKSERYGVRFDTRITSFEEITENNMKKLKLTLGNPEISLKKELEVTANG